MPNIGDNWAWEAQERGWQFSSYYFAICPVCHAAVQYRGEAIQAHEDWHNDLKYTVASELLEDGLVGSIPDQTNARTST